MDLPKCKFVYDGLSYNVHLGYIYSIHVPINQQKRPPYRNARFDYSFYTQMKQQMKTTFVYEIKSDSLELSVAGWVVF